MSDDDTTPQDNAHTHQPSRSSPPIPSYVKSDDIEEEGPHLGEESVKNDDEGGSCTQTVPKDRCQYTKGGVCRLHGRGAMKLWKPVPIVTVGADGSEVRRMGRKTYYVCDLGLRGSGKLSQTKLSSFFSTTKDGVKDTNL